MSPWMLAAATALAAPLAPALEFADDVAAPLVASIYSLPPQMVEAEEAGRFLAAVRALAPGRDLVALTDEPLLSALRPLARRERIHLLPGGAAFSLWPRDPFLLGRRPGGGVVAVARPNLQPGREADAAMAAALARGLPADVARSWGGISAAVAPLPFHGGNLLQTGDTAWTTIHGLEIPILERLELAAVPVESFATPQGRQRYLDAARAAAAELGRWLHREVRFVHADPDTFEQMRGLGGGAGFDLDSIVTFLSGAGGQPTALVGDVAAGVRLLAAAPEADLAAFRSSYGLEPEPDGLRRALSAYAASQRAAGLARFADLCADHLRARGHHVERLPLLLVPTAALVDRAGVEHPDFLVTWNNVVVEPGRAEGFASGLPAGDALARATFAAAGSELRLVPMLRRSVVLTGGYRCASNHLRAGPVD